MHLAILGKDALADDVSEQEEEDTKSQAADAGDLANGLEDIRIHGCSRAVRWIGDPCLEFRSKVQCVSMRQCF